MTAKLSCGAPNFVPWDIEVARINFGANCGPVSFAAITGKEVCRVMRHFLHFKHSPWTNLTQMRRALADAGFMTAVQKCAFPNHGVALVQWLGPWTEKDFFSRWSLAHTHWVAVDGEWIFDHTVGEWQMFEEWGKVAWEFVSEIPRATGWRVKYSVEVSKVNLAASCPAEVRDAMSLAPC